MDGLTQTRIPSYDLLRVVAAVSVVCLHMAGPYGEMSLPSDASHYAVAGVFCHSVTRFAVPCFFMLSGAFLLGRQEHGDFHYFYRKSLRKLGLPVLACTALFLGYRILLLFRSGAMLGGAAHAARSLSPVFVDLAQGRVFYHMWYISVLAGLYLITPMLVRLRRQMGAKAWDRMAWLWLLWSVASGWTNDPPLAWDIGNAFSYGGYFAIGSVLSRRVREDECRSDRRALRFRAGIRLLAAALLLCATALWQWEQRAGRIGGLSAVSNFSPTVVLASLLIFAAFGSIGWSRDLSRCASRTYWVYLLHPLVLEWLGAAVLSRLPGRPDPVWWIPVATLLVFAVSYGFAALLQRMGLGS